MNRDSFYVAVAEALSGCQLVEQELKLYITEALDLARRCVAGRFPFKLSGDDYQDASLERLIETFKKLTENEVLLTDLRSFKAERNFLSHKGIAHCLDFEGDLFNPIAEEYSVRLTKIRNEASRLQLAVFNEATNIRLENDFGDLPE